MDTDFIMLFAVNACVAVVGVILFNAYRVAALAGA